MKYKFGEIFAIILVITTMVVTPFIVLSFSPRQNNSNVKLICLTAVAKDGVWTDEKVDASNYTYKTFKPATIILKEGEEVLFRFTSVDVTHSFYIPELNLGPVEVEAGHYYDVPFKATKIGSFIYYCTKICGNCHFYMQGKLIILGKNTNLTEAMISKMQKDSTAVTSACCMQNNATVLSSNFIEKGKQLFVIKNCVTCHGKEGKGGIKNYNYAKPSIPDLITLATKLKIPDKESADTIIKLLEKNADFEKLSDDPPFRTYDRFLAQYNSIYNKILNGAPIVLKADSTGPKPPLFMPSWEQNLTKEEIRSIISYLISKNNWEDE